MHQKLIGAPWVAGGRGPNEFDCWGLVMYWYKHHKNAILPDSPTDARDIKAVAANVKEWACSDVWVELKEPETDSVVVMGRSNGVMTHVGVHVDGGFVLHASVDSKNVIMQTLFQLERYWPHIKHYRYNR